ncbi:signal peptidase I [Brevibacillus composti]|uniref:Signal peptidase I n=1 Tax=Brevibacillus composti TaxID=2796470 RepID=A0A7T5JNW3_9BACL|nr:signal peptidase I [Brevibacillus composti]QQE74833.1 signal peptidase I [Brevibacillus composti]QUO41917.1 signal peptidase I [Brevibacillus composti]
MAFRWGKRLFLVIVCLLVAVNLFFSISSRLNADRMPGAGSWRVLAVLTGSMSPTINAGDMVIVQSYGEKRPAVGEIVTYWQEEGGGSLTTHRIVHQLANGYLQTKGDANLGVDGGWTHPDRLVGTVVARIPYAAAIQEGLQQPLVLLALTVLFLAWPLLAMRGGDRQPQTIQSETIEGEPT